MHTSADINITVVIPSYNRQSRILNCLTSVLSQTYSPAEIIVVDDCSSDETVKIIKEQKFPGVRCIVLPKKSGAQAARNRGIKEAKGNWIAFQDSDDEWDPRKLEHQIEALRQVNFEPMTVVHCNCWRDDHQTGLRTLWELPLIDGQNVFSQLLISPGPLFPTLLTSKTALEKIGLLDERVPSFQEWDTSLRLAKYCRFIHLQESLFIYHLHAGETISQNKKRHLEGFQYIIDKFKDEIIQNCGIHSYNKLLLNNVQNALLLGYCEDAEHFLAKSDGITAKILILKLMARFRIKPDFYSKVKSRIKSAVVDIKKCTNRTRISND